MTSGIFVGLSTIDLIHSVDEFPCGSSFVEALRAAASIAVASRQFDGTREWMSMR
jgi:hypothetical protein